MENITEIKRRVGRPKVERTREELLERRKTYDKRYNNKKNKKIDLYNVNQDFIKMKKIKEKIETRKNNMMIRSRMLDLINYEHENIDKILLEINKEKKEKIERGCCVFCGRKLPNKKTVVYIEVSHKKCFDINHQMACHFGNGYIKKFYDNKTGLRTNESASDYFN